MKFIREKKIKLVSGVTPLEESIFRGVSFLMKRDDLTGTETSGNKIRKLQYLLFEAVASGATVIYTCGGGQSNHCRATVIAARKTGIPVRLFLWEDADAPSEGNLFFNRLYSKSIEYLSFENYLKVNDIMLENARREEASGGKVFIIPEGGSSVTGITGATECYIEIINQLAKREQRIKSITVAAGSGGTAAGLLLGAAMLRKKTKIFAVPVLYEGSDFRERILELALKSAKKYGISTSGIKDNLELIPGYSKEGYKSIAVDTLSVIREFAMETGILFDPVYTGKAFAAYSDKLLGSKRHSPHLFLHTGGLFGWFGKGTAREELLKQSPVKSDF